MAKLIYSAITSLDGYVADEQGNFEWAAPGAEVHAFVNELVRPIGTYLFGRRMYDVMSVWETMTTSGDAHPVEQDFARIWQTADKIVFSKSLEKASTAKTRIERDFDPREIRQLKSNATVTSAWEDPISPVRRSKPGWSTKSSSSSPRSWWEAATTGSPNMSAFSWNCSKSAASSAASCISGIARKCKTPAWRDNSQQYAKTTLLWFCVRLSGDVTHAPSSLVLEVSCFANSRGLCVFRHSWSRCCCWPAHCFFRLRLRRILNWSSPIPPRMRCWGPRHRKSISGTASGSTPARDRPAVEIIDEQGNRSTADANVDPNDPYHVIATTGAIDTGLFTVNWTVRSLDDGHTLSGSFSFRVGGSDRAPGAATTEGQRPQTWNVITRWLFFIGASLVTGLALLLALIAFWPAGSKTPLANATKEGDSADPLALDPHLFSTGVRSWPPSERSSLSSPHSQNPFCRRNTRHRAPARRP